jgi:hypothetical protein
LEDIKAGEQIRTLPCFHFLHSKCADLYFARPSVSEDGPPRLFCPVCRIKVEPQEFVGDCPTATDSYTWKT